MRGAGLVLLAAALWGTLGTYYKFGADTLGLVPLSIVFWRAGMAALALGVVLGAVLPAAGKGWGLLRVRARDLPLFAAFGLLGVTAFYLLYIYAVLLVGVAVAVVLLYTAPVFVALMAWRFLGEGFDRRKVAALALTVVGCAMVARAYNPALLQVNAVGILCGLGSAFTYALYSILGKFSLNRGYHISTMSFYVYAIGVAGLLVVSLFVGPPLVPGASAWVFLLVLGLVQTVGALWAYTAGLRHLEAGVASILATFEPVVAALLAFFVLHEKIEGLQVAGGALILSAVILLQARRTAPDVPHE